MEADATRPAAQRIVAPDEAAQRSNAFTAPALRLRRWTPAL